MNRSDEMIRLLQPGSESSAVEQDRRPHILLVIDQFPKALGGGERIALRLASLLPAYGYRVSILTFFAHPQSAALDAFPCPVYELPLRRTYDWAAIRGALSLHRFLQTQNVSLVQTFFESSDLWAGLIAKMAPGIKLVWSRRDMGILRSRKHHLAYRVLSDLPDAVLTVSEQVRQYCIEVDGIDPARVHTIYNGLNLSDWTTDSRPEKTPGPLSVTSIGNIRRVKGHDILIKAAALVVTDYPEVSFTIAGEVIEPDYFAQLQSLVTRLDLSRNFRFLGPVSDLRQVLAGADLFVLPSRSEGFSNAIVEAMAASLPVIATDVGGNREAVQHGVTGFLVPPDDPPALAHAVKTLIAAPSKARAMGLAGVSRVAERFTTDAMLQGIVSIYQNLLTETELSQQTLNST